MGYKAKMCIVTFILGLLLASNSLATTPTPNIYNYVVDVNVPLSGNITVKINNETPEEQKCERISDTEFSIYVTIPKEEWDILKGKEVKFYLNGSILLNTSEPITFDPEKYLYKDITLYYSPPTEEEKKEEVTTPEEKEEVTTPEEKEEVTTPEEVIIPTIPTEEEKKEEVTTPEEEETIPTEEEKKEEVTTPEEEITPPTEEEEEVTTPEEETAYHTKKGPISILSPINKIIAKDLISKEIGYFVYRAELIVGSEIDLNYAENLKNIIELTDMPLEIREDCILVGGPVANPVVKKYLNFFPVKVTNEYPGKNRGVIEVTKINGNTVVLLAGSDRWGTKAAVEYFKTLEDLPDEPIFVEWRDGKAVKIERP